MSIKEIVNELKDKYELVIGWIGLVLKPSLDRNYKYIIDHIEIKEAHQQRSSIVYYKLIGCRKALFDSAVELNKTAVFSLFRPDHAQMIVSIATAEILMQYSRGEALNKFKKYVEFCNIKLNGR